MFASAPSAGLHTHWHSELADAINSVTSIDIAPLDLRVIVEIAANDYLAIPTS